METTRPVDLWVALGWTILTGLAALAGIEGALRVVLGAVFVLFLPGYTLLGVLYPARNPPETERTDEQIPQGLSPFQRFALSLGLSIAIVAGLLLVLHFSPWPLSQVAVVTALGSFNLAAGVAGLHRRRELAPDDRLRLRVAVPASLRSSSTFDRTLNVLLVASLVAAAGTLVYVAVDPNPGEPFTEFYVLGPEGAAEYPENVTAGEPLDVTVGIENHEHRRATYGVTVQAQEGEWIRMEDRRAFRAQSNTTLDGWTVALADGEAWEETRSLTLPEEGSYRILFDLGFEDAGEATYRTLRLYVNVTSG